MTNKRNPQQHRISDSTTLPAPAVKAEISLIDIDLIDENEWNPNEMSEEAFGELLAELQHLGDVPKPIIVRQVHDRYQIIDGAHARGSRGIGLD